MSRLPLLYAASMISAALGGAALHDIADAAVAQAVGPDSRPRPPVVGAPAPDWHNESWLNADHPLTLPELRGRVVLLNFWVFTCYNCTNTVPSLVDFDRKYRGQGLTLIGIHTPEFPPYAGEHDRSNVGRALRKYGIEYPNAQDNDSKTWNLYGIRYWPSFVLIDKQGTIRFQGYGEFHLNDGSYRTWDARIRELLAE